MGRPHGQKSWSFTAGSAGKDWLSVLLLKIWPTRANAVKYVPARNLTHANKLLNSVKVHLNVLEIGAIVTSKEILITMS